MCELVGEKQPVVTPAKEETPHSFAHKLLGEVSVPGLNIYVAVDLAREALSYYQGDFDHAFLLEADQVLRRITNSWN